MCNVYGSRSTLAELAGVFSVEVGHGTNLPEENYPTFLVIRATNSLDNKFEIAGPIHKLEALTGPVGEEAFDPRPAFADAIENDLATGAVADVGGGQLGHQEAPVGIDRYMTLAPDNFLPAS
jgi:hypothetical protein